MMAKRFWWEAMEKNDIPLFKLAKHYFITCHTEGNTPSTVRGYRESWATLFSGARMPPWETRRLAGSGATAFTLVG